MRNKKSRRSHSSAEAGQTIGLFTLTRLKRPKRSRPLVRATAVAGAVVLAATAAGAWLSHRADQVRVELTAASQLLPQFKQQLMSKDESARTTLDEIEAHTDAARSAATDPLWATASALPWIGPNFSAISEVALSADDLVNRAAKPILSVSKTLDWRSLTPVDGKLNVEPIAAASPSIVSAANTIELTYSRLSRIDPSTLIPQVAAPLIESTRSLDEMRQAASTAADASKILPDMLGAEGPRNYLVLIQNNAEVRATGGLAGALAVLSVENGSIALTAQSTGASLGPFKPSLPVDPIQAQIYTSRLGTFIGDVNLTPDFPTTGNLAKTMWETRHNGNIDGVVALDPVVLANILSAAGPIVAPNTPDMPMDALPRTLTGTNIVKTLLSDVYQSIGDNDVQDEYFAKVSQSIFDHIASGKVPGEKLLGALTKSADEKRLHIWSDHVAEQAILTRTALGGSISGPSVGGATFGVYFNDGTGAKMDFYVRRTVQLLQECPVNGYARVKVRVTMSNEAPLDAAAALPKLVTGGGLYGVPPGSVQTNVVVYGPAQAQIETVHQDNVKTAFGSQLDRERPVGTLTTRLKPGQKSTVEFTFGKIVQDDDPALIVTPTVQPAEDVILAPKLTDCTTG